VLDAPPVLPAADVPELLPFADAALLVIRAQTTPRELAKRAIEMLGKQLRGVVFNEVTVDSNPHYRYLSQYYPKGLDAKSRGAGSDKGKKEE
jgi:Mrp family chromosome partitioning ATPase